MAVNLSNSFLQRGVFPPVKKVTSPVVSKPLKLTCRKKGLHPEFFDDAKVYCNGELVMTTGGTKKEYVVDVWSGNHPFYQGDRELQVEDSHVENFRRKYEGSLPDDWFVIPVLKGEVVLPPRRKSKDKKK